MSNVNGSSRFKSTLLDVSKWDIVWPCRTRASGPGYHSIDVAIARRIRLRARSTMELRGELFDITNTPPLGAPNAVLETPGFGSITCAGDPRVASLQSSCCFERRLWRG